MNKKRPLITEYVYVFVVLMCFAAFLFNYHGYGIKTINMPIRTERKLVSIYKI